MSAAPGALTPTVNVSLTDGRNYTAETSMADLLAWERYAVAHGFSPMESPFSMLIFYMWRAARKAGICPNETGLDAFAETIADFDVEDGEPPGPTRPVPTAG